MEIRKDSFVYRMLAYYTRYDEMPNNLCEVVSAFLFYSFITFVLLCFAILLFLSMGFMLFVVPIEFWLGLTTHHEIFLVLSMLIWVLVGSLIIELYRKTEHYANSRKFFDSKQVKVKEQKPSIIREYLKARKEKWCPTVEYVD